MHKHMPNDIVGSTAPQKHKTHRRQCKMSSSKKIDLVTQVEKLKSSQVLRVVAASTEDDIRLSSLLHPLATAITLKLILFNAQSTYRVATAAFWRTFHHDGKISPGWWGCGGARPPPFILFTISYKVAVYAPAERADTPALFHLYPCILCIQC